MREIKKCKNYNKKLQKVNCVDHHKVSYLTHYSTSIVMCICIYDVCELNETADVYIIISCSLLKTNKNIELHVLVVKRKKRNPLNY